MDPFKILHLVPNLKGHIGKLVQEDQGMKRIIRPVYCRNTDPPKFIALPFTVCFNFPGTQVTHSEVKMAIDSKLEILAGQYVVQCIQFLPLASTVNVKGMENRWVITFNKNEPKLELIRFGIKVRGIYATVRDYSDVQRVEIALWQLANPEKPEDLLGTSSMESSRPSTTASRSGLMESPFSYGNTEVDRIKRMLLKRKPTFAELQSMLHEDH